MIWPWFENRLFQTIVVQSGHFCSTDSPWLMISCLMTVQCYDTPKKVLISYIQSSGSWAPTGHVIPFWALGNQPIFTVVYSIPRSHNCNLCQFLPEIGVPEQKQKQYPKPLWHSLNSTYLLNDWGDSLNDAAKKKKVCRMMTIWESVCLTIIIPD